MTRPTGTEALLPLIKCRKAWSANSLIEGLSSGTGLVSISTTYPVNQKEGQVISCY